MRKLGVTWICWFEVFCSETQTPVAAVGNRNTASCVADAAGFSVLGIVKEIEFAVFYP
jgi:hypothetical protein